MFASHKNSYLQMITSSVNPRIINRCVDKAMEKPTIDAFDQMPPFNRLMSAYPCIPIQNCDVTRRPLAFERWALPKLLKELNSTDTCVVRQAITSVCDLVHDPERNYEAIKLHFPARMANLLIHSDIDVRERTIVALVTIGNLLDGKNAIVKNRRLLENLQICMNDLELPVRFQAFRLIEELSLVWMVADLLVDNGFVELLIDRLLHVYEVEDSYVIALILQALDHLMYCNGKFLALESGLYDLLLEILDKNNNEEVIGWSLKCVSVLTQTEQGKEIALKKKLLKRYLYRYIFSEIQIVFENTVAAMLFATLRVEALVKAVKLPKLVDRLIDIAKNPTYPAAQRYAMQVLANLTGHGAIKKYLLEEKVQELQDINVGDDPNSQRVKEILLVDSLKF